MGFGIKLKEILCDKGMSMTELSKRTGITYNMIKKYCSGNADPTFSYAQMIAKELDLSLDAFMSYTATSNKPMLQQVFEEDFTFICGFMRNVHKYGDKTAVIDPYNGTEVTYKDLNLHVNMLSNALFDRQVEIGDVVLYQFPNSVEFLYCYLAPQKIGAVNSPVDFRFSAEQTAQCLDISKPKVYIYDSSIVGTARKALALADWTPEYVVMSGEGNLPHGHIRYEDFIKDSPKYNPRIEYCIWVYDESTRLYETDVTGTLAGIQLFSLNEVLSAHDVLMKFPMNPSDISMTLIPWTYRHSLHAGGPTSTLYSGGTVMIVRDFDSASVMDWINQYQVSYLTGMSSDVIALTDYSILSSVSAPSLKGVMMVGALIDPVDQQKVRGHLCPLVINGFGTSESFWNIFSSSCDSCESPGFVGNSCVDDDVRVARLTPDEHIDPMLLAARDNKEIGEIIVRSSKTSYKYIGNENADNLCYHDGWLHTGYLATWDKNRRITIVGNQKGETCNRESS